MQNYIKTLNDIFGIFWNNGLLHSHVLIEESNQTWSLFTFMPYKNDCFSLASIKLASFTPLNSTKIMNTPMEELYPKKLKNFIKCPLYAAIFHVQPFVILENVSQRVKGLYVTIINQISRTINSTVVFNIPLNNDFMNSVLKGEANFTISLLSPDRFFLWTMSDAVLHFPFEFIYKEANSYFDYSITRLLAPLTPYVWYLVAAVILLTVVTILLTKKLTRKRRHFVIGGWMNRSPILNMWAIVLGLSIMNRRISKRKFFGTFARTLALFWMILWLIIRNSYQGQLYTYLYL